MRVKFRVDILELIFHVFSFDLCKRYNELLLINMTGSNGVMKYESIGQMFVCDEV